jgi:environmental stress-induced protein Ves
MPWKNGRGVTEQILVEPEGAPIDAFAWRVSTAIVSEGGEFSAFSGCERVLVVIEGDGLSLDGVPVPPLAPHRFSGDDVTRAELASGPIRDFNVIARRDYAIGCDVVHVTSERTLATGGDALLYCVRGALTCDGRELGAGDAVRARGDGRFTVGGDGVAIHVRVAPAT